MQARARLSTCPNRVVLQVVAAALVFLAWRGEPAANTSLSASPSEVAKAKYERAARAYQSGRPGDAILLLEESLRLHSSPNARLLLGHCHRDLGRLGTAYRTYQATEREAAERLRAGQRQYDEARKDALGNMADLQGRVPYLTLAVPAGLPVDFTILLDGLPVAPELWGAKQALDPGKHEIAATGTKLRKFSQTIDLRPGKHSRIDILLEREASAEVRLHLADAPAGTLLLVDGQPSAVVKETTFLYLDPGVHHLLLRAPGHRSVRWQRPLENGEQVSLRPTLRRATPRAAVLALGALTLVTLVTTIALGAQAQIEDAANRPADGVVTEPSREAFAVRDRIRILAGVATGFAPLSGALGAATLGLALTADWSSPPAARPGPTALAPFGGLRLMTWGGQ